MKKTFNEEKFADELDSRWHEFQRMSFQDMQDVGIRKRLFVLTELFKKCPNKCGNCGYPIPDDNYRVLGAGDVCRLCYDLYHAVHDRSYFVNLHIKWTATNAEKKRQEERRDDNFQY